MRPAQMIHTRGMHVSPRRVSDVWHSAAHSVAARCCGSQFGCTGRKVGSQKCNEIRSSHHTLSSLQAVKRRLSTWQCSAACNPARAAYETRQPRCGAAGRVSGRCAKHAASSGHLCTEIYFHELCLRATAAWVTGCTPQGGCTPTPLWSRRPKNPSTLCMQHFGRIRHASVSVSCHAMPCHVM